VAKFWPDACDQTEFVGIACKDEWKDMKFTAISYGVKRCETTPKAGGLAVGASSEIISTPTCPSATTDEVVFIAVMTGRIKIPDSCLQCDQTDYNSDGSYTGQCKEPKELQATIYVSYFDAAQDVDHDGFPDWKCDEAVLCVRCETCLERVELVEPCEAESKSYVACLLAYKGSDTAATGRLFLRNIEAEQKLCFVLTVRDITDVTRAAIQVDGSDVVTLFPFPPDTNSKDGDCEGLLSCGCFYPKDCSSSWKNRKFVDIVKDIEDGKATVVVCTRKSTTGEIGGKIQDP